MPTLPGPAHDPVEPRCSPTPLEKPAGPPHTPAEPCCPPDSKLQLRESQPSPKHLLKKARQAERAAVNKLAITHNASRAGAGPAAPPLLPDILIPLKWILCQLLSKPCDTLFYENLGNAQQGQLKARWFPSWPGSIPAFLLRLVTFQYDEHLAGGELAAPAKECHCPDN